MRRPLVLFSLLAAATSTLRSGAARPRDARAVRHPARGVEPLEPRQLLSAAGIVPVGTQPSGGLDDKIVYLHAGHGYTSSATSWDYQRPLLLDLVEDLGNQDQMTILADYLWNAGATIVPLRPIGHQVNEVVLDNDDVGVTFSGPWSVGSGSIYYTGDSNPDAVPYRFATTSATETAVATYRPTIPEAGFYPIYTWAPAGSNRATQQIYRINHTGGATEVTIDHSRVGNGLVYLGTYHFEAGTSGSVEISNRSSEGGKVVVADMIRFGNGMGDINRGAGVSGQPREDEAGLYWVEWHAVRAQGVPSSAYRTSSDDRTATVSLSPRYAAFMNQAGVGQLSDRVFVSYHTNASTGVPSTATQRGVLGLLNGNNRASAATPNQFLLADSLARQVNDDLVAQNGLYEFTWFNRSTVTLDRTDIEFGEINNEVIGGEFDATIIEAAFHDNTQDARLLLDPKVRDAIARATYQGIVDYFDALDTTTPNLDAPPPVTDLSVTTTAPGVATLRWTPGAPGSYAGGPAAGFEVYASTDGYGFDGGRYVAGGAAASTTLTGLDPNQTYYFRVVARNAGGESPGSEVVAVRPSGDAKRVLVVNGFDRLDRTMDPQEPFPGGGLVSRVRAGESNSRDYVIQLAGGIDAAGAGASIATASNEAVQRGDVPLAGYDAVFWILGEESRADNTFSGAEQAAVAAYLAQGGKLFVSGSEIGYDLDLFGAGQSFYNNTLRADYVSDDANTYQASGVEGSIFQGLSIQFDNGQRFYDVGTPDVIAPSAGSTVALAYANRSGAAAVQYANGAERLVMAAFPLETILDDQVRVQAIGRVLDFFEIQIATPDAQQSLLLDNDTGPPVYAEAGIGWATLAQAGFGGGTQRAVVAGQAASAAWVTTLPSAGQVEVFVRYTAGPDRASAARYEVVANGASLTATIDQRALGDSWVSLGTIQAGAGPLAVALDAAASTGAPGALVVADVVRVDLVGPAQPTGDYNGDGVVNAADYTIWRDRLGSVGAPGGPGDGNFTGLVNQLDYGVWANTYAGAPGLALSSSSADAVSAPGPSPLRADYSAIDEALAALVVVPLDAPDSINPQPDAARVVRPSRPDGAEFSKVSLLLRSQYGVDKNGADKNGADRSGAEAKRPEKEPLDGDHGAAAGAGRQALRGSGRPGAKEQLFGGPRRSAR